MKIIPIKKWNTSAWEEKLSAFRFLNTKTHQVFLGSETYFRLGDILEELKFYRTPPCYPGQSNTPTAPLLRSKPLPNEVNVGGDPQCLRTRCWWLPRKVNNDIFPYTWSVLNAWNMDTIRKSYRWPTTRKLCCQREPDHREKDNSNEAKCRIKPKF